MRKHRVDALAIMVLLMVGAFWFLLVLAAGVP